VVTGSKRVAGWLKKMKPTTIVLLSDGDAKEWGGMVSPQGVIVERLVNNGRVPSGRKAHCRARGGRTTDRGAYRARVAAKGADSDS